MQKIKLILALSVLLGSAAAFAEPQSCNARTVEGTYVYKGDGWAGTGDSRKPISITGVRTFYASTYSVTNQFHESVTDGGTPFTTTTDGSYSVIPAGDARGTCRVTITLGGGGIILSGVTSDNGNHISVIATSGSYTVSEEHVRVSKNH
jgi:hypothetical protein